MTPQFANFDVASFLRESWQKKPCLIRNPWRNWANPLEPDELAGLACEDGVDSRIVRREGGGWDHEAGPLEEDRFTALGPAPWTLLVQSVDHHVPAVADLIEPFRFIPDWRIDDVMVSYAVDGGGVGAHFDQYDVFLVQGLGRRRWQVGALCDERTPLQSHDHLRLLAEFEPLDEWVLEPGDILYVPPGFAHNGVAVGADCMTYSIGFRAPSRGELITGWADGAMERLDDDDRFTDSDYAGQGHPGEIAGSALMRMQAMIAETLADDTAFRRWFGEFSTASKSPEIDWQPEVPATAADVRKCVQAGKTLLRNPASRFAFARQGDGMIVLFVDGTAFDCERAVEEFLQTLCAQREIAAKELHGQEGLIVDLINQGSMAFADDLTDEITP